MTPEDVESRLQGLKTPEPSEGLRARCLAPQRPASRSRMALALAASFLVVALTGWLILTPTPPVKPADGIPVEPGTASLSWPDDPRLQEKVDRMFRANPGKCILVVQVRQLRAGRIEPVKKGFNLKILLDPAEIASVEAPDGPHAEVDADGTLLFVAAPGRYRGRGYHRSQGEGLLDLSFVWEYKDLVLIAGDVIHLPDAVFAPWMEWATPEEGGELSLKADSVIGWKPYAEVRAVRIGIERVSKGADGIEQWETLGFLKRECPGENRFPLSELLKVSRFPFRAGETLVVSLEGFEGDGKKIASCKTKRRFTLKE